MSHASSKKESRFLTDRMLGTLTRYLRFMGYDTISANDLLEGDRREDTLLLGMARAGGRTLLTRDRELARRGGVIAVWIMSEQIRDQVQQLADLHLISPRLRMNRCSLCNQPLRRARWEEICSAKYAPRSDSTRSFYWCPRCRKLYWMGSHGTDLNRRLNRYLSEKEGER